MTNYRNGEQVRHRQVSGEVGVTFWDCFRVMEEARVLIMGVATRTEGQQRMAPDPARS